MGRYDNPLHVGVHTVSQGREALLHVAIGTFGGVSLDRCPAKKDGVCQCTTKRVRLQPPYSQHGGTP